MGAKIEWGCVNTEHIQNQNLNLMFRFGMVWYKIDWDHSYSYSTNPLKTEPVQRNTKWQLFGQIRFQFLNATISTSEKLSTIRNPNVFNIQACTVFT